MIIDTSFRGRMRPARTGYERTGRAARRPRGWISSDLRRGGSYAMRSHSFGAEESRLRGSTRLHRRRKAHNDVNSMRAWRVTSRAPSLQVVVRYRRREVSDPGIEP